MGLDMYLYTKSKQEQIEDGAGEDHHDIGYWRKFNALHHWFVDNVQGGEDECKEHEVYIDDLKDLQAILLRIKDHPDEAETLLPTTMGFFFGSNEYDDYYYEMVDYTLDVIENALDNPDETYYYVSSW